MRLVARGADAAEGPVLHARDRRSGAARPRRLPARRRARRPRCAPRPTAAGLAAAAPAGEPGGVLPRAAATTAASSSGTGSSAVAGRHRRRGGRRARTSRGPLAVHARPAPRPRRRVARSRSTSLRSEPRVQHARRRAAQRARGRAHVAARGRALRPGRARSEVKLRYRSAPVGASVVTTEDGFALELDEPVDAVAPGQVAVLYDGDVVVGAGIIEQRQRGRIPRDDARLLRRRRGLLGPRDLPRRCSASGRSSRSSSSGGCSTRCRRSSPGPSATLLPVVVKTGGTVDRVNYQLDKLDTVTDSAVSMADSADTAVRAVSTAISKPVEKVSGLHRGRRARLRLVPQEPELRRMRWTRRRTPPGAARRISPRTSGAPARRRSDERRPEPTPPPTPQPPSPSRGRRRSRPEADPPDEPDAGPHRAPTRRGRRLTPPTASRSAQLTRVRRDRLATGVPASSRDRLRAQGIA